MINREELVEILVEAGMTTPVAKNTCSRIFKTLGMKKRNDTIEVGSLMSWTTTTTSKYKTQIREVLMSIFSNAEELEQEVNKEREEIMELLGSKPKFPEGVSGTPLECITKMYILSGKSEKFAKYLASKAIDENGNVKLSSKWYQYF